ncbi:MAG: hypothetical protein V1816_25340 [Pseudomonadota bacterium]
MKKTVRVIWASFLLVLLGTGPAWAEDAAMVVDVAGPPPVYEKGARRGRQVILMDFLECGDQVNLETGATLVLNYFSSGAREEIKGPGRIEIGAQGSRETNRISISSSKVDYIPPLAELKVFDDQPADLAVLAERKPGSRPGSLEEEPTTEAAVLTRGLRLPPSDGASQQPAAGPVPSPSGAPSVEVHITKLCNTAVRGEPIEFAWQPLEGATKYELTLRDSSGQISWEGSTSGLTHTMSGVNLPLGEEFTWEVRAFSKNKMLAEGQANFHTLTRDLLSQVAYTETYIRKNYSPESTESRIALAMLYKKYKLNDDAKAILTVLAEKFPDNENVRLQLLWLERNPPR